MPVVETVRGPVDTSELGATLMHEHIFIASTEAIQNWGSAFGAPYWDEELRVADAIAKLRAVREAGIRTLVDPTVPGIGRYIPRIQRVNAAAGDRGHRREPGLRPLRDRALQPDG